MGAGLLFADILQVYKMRIPELKEKLHNAIEAIEDENYLQATAVILLKIKSSNTITLPKVRFKTLQERGANYLKRTGNGYILNDLKQLITFKDVRSSYR